MTETFIPAAGATLATEAFGDPAAPPVLLLMGATASMLWWPEDFVGQLAAAGRYVIRYDMRDTGRSTTFPHGAPPYTLEDLADDAVAVLDAYGLTRAHLVGMSLGGLVAQIVALKYPARTEALTLISSQIFGPADFPDPEIDPALMAHFHAGQRLDWRDEAAVVAHVVAGWKLTAGPAHAFDAALMESLARADFERATDPEAALNHQLLAGGDAWFGRTATIAAPVHLIHGTADQVIPIAHAEAVAKALPGTPLLRLAGVGHELHRADWPAIIEVLLRPLV